MQTYVAILAAGKGSRTGLETPKQFQVLNGATLLDHCLAAFENHPSIDGVILVVHPDYLDRIRQDYLGTQHPKIKAVVAGGKERIHSGWAAIEACRSLVASDCHLLLHDAARPFVTADLISRIVTALPQNEAFTTAIPASDTIYQQDASGALQCLPRQSLFLAQTPQGGRLSLLLKVFAQALEEENYAFTDEAGLILHYAPHCKLQLIPGESTNRKITFASDLTNTRL